MAGMSVSTGLISGIDYSTMISQLMQVEANPQTLLKTQLTATQSDASAYRAVNTRFDTLRQAAAALTADTAWTATKATSSSSSVTATASAGAAPGALSFAVTSVATTHSYLTNGGTWASSATTYGASSITIDPQSGDPVSIPLAANATLADAVAAINASKTGVTAAAVNVGSGFRLQVTATNTGAAGSFTIDSPFAAGGTDRSFVLTSTARNAELDLGGGFVASSSSNTFTDLLPGVSVTVSKADPTELTTVSVKKDPDSIATKVKNLVDAANGLLQGITDYTDPTNDKALLKGDSTLRGLANQVLDIFSSGVGGVSAQTLGVKLTREGKLEFDSAAFTAKLASDPDAVKDLLTRKTTVNAGVDGISGNADDVTNPIGFAAKLEALAKNASDATKGSLVLLAKSQDTLAKDLEDRIAAWDTRLALRETALTRQFTAMEKALGTLQNQGAWLSSQLAGLPSWSSSK